MKRLREEADSSLAQLTQLVQSAEPYQSGPFAKRHVQSRIARALDGGVAPRRRLGPVWLGAGALLIAATAAAAGYTWLGPGKDTVPPPPEAQVAPVAPAPRPVVPPPPAAEVTPPEAAPPPPSVEAPSSKPQAKPRAGEDPSQVAEAVRALRKQGDAARAQALLDQYLKSNPHGALSEDALALSIEAAAARKDPRAADYARRYLARYPRGRFRPLAERALSH
jgi:outer membrane biosynthesis protein TonB